jgi:hypothetical protein
VHGVEPGRAQPGRPSVQRPATPRQRTGQACDSPQFTAVLDATRVARTGPGRPRTRPDRVLADKAYSSRANRAHLPCRGIAATIPQPCDQIRNRRRRGRAGGRPPAFCPETYKQRHAVLLTHEVPRKPGATSGCSSPTASPSDNAMVNVALTCREGA